MAPYFFGIYLFFCFVDALILYFYRFLGGGWRVVSVLQFNNADSQPADSWSNLTVECSFGQARVPHASNENLLLVFQLQFVHLKLNILITKHIDIKPMHTVNTMTQCKVTYIYIFIPTHFGTYTH